jgi:hypothetical protein
MQQGLHRHAIADTARTAISTQFARFVEADRDEALPRVSRAQTSVAFCLVNKIIKVEAFLPQRPLVQTSTVLCHL